MLPPDQEQALPEVALLPRRPGPEAPHLRRGHEKTGRGRVPVLRAPGLLGEGERLQRGPGGRPHRLQQVHDQVRGEGLVPPAGAGAPLPRAAHQQDAVVRGGGPLADGHARGVREAAGGVRAREHRPGAVVGAL